MRRTSSLLEVLPGTTARWPDSSVASADACTSRRSPPLRCRSSGPWHLKQRSESSGLTWKLKSTRSGTPAIGGAVVRPQPFVPPAIASSSAAPPVRAAARRDDLDTVPALCPRDRSPDLPRGNLGGAGRTSGATSADDVVVHLVGAPLHLDEAAFVEPPFHLGELVAVVDPRRDRVEVGQQLAVVDLAAAGRPCRRTEGRGSAAARSRATRTSGSPRYGRVAARRTASRTGGRRGRRGRRGDRRRRASGRCGAARRGSTPGRTRARRAAAGTGRRRRLP